MNVKPVVEVYISRMQASNFIKVNQDVTHAMQHFVVYTDGHCDMYHGTHGAGGWGFIVAKHEPDNNTKIIGEEAWFSNKATSEQMALEAILRAVEFLPFDTSCIIRTDCIHAIGWLNFGKKRTRPDVAHLTSQIESVIAYRRIKASFEYVDANKKNEFDTRCEALAMLDIIPNRRKSN